MTHTVVVAAETLATAVRLASRKIRIGGQQVFILN